MHSLLCLIKWRLQQKGSERLQALSGHSIPGVVCWTISNPPFHLDVCISSGVLYSEANENSYLCFLWLWRFYFLKNDVSGGRRCSHERLEIKQ